jgi:hypothetical protein
MREKQPRPESATSIYPARCPDVRRVPEPVETHDSNRRFHTNQPSPLLTHHFQLFTELRHGCYRYWYSRHSFEMTRKHLLGGVGSAQRYEDLPRIAGRCAESPAATPKPVNTHPPRRRHCCSPTPPRCLMAMDGPNGRCRRKTRAARLMDRTTGPSPYVAREAELMSTVPEFQLPPRSGPTVALSAGGGGCLATRQPTRRWGLGGRVLVVVVGSPGCDLPAGRTRVWAVWWFSQAVS